MQTARSAGRGALGAERWARSAGRGALGAERWARSAGRGALGTERWARSAGRGALGAERWARSAGHGAAKNFRRRLRPRKFFASPYEGRGTRQCSSALMGTPPVATGRQRIRFTHIGRMLLIVHLIGSITSNIIPCRKKYQRSPLLLCVAKASVNRSENRTA